MSNINVKSKTSKILKINNLTTDLSSSSIKLSKVLIIYSSREETKNTQKITLSISDALKINAISITEIWEHKIEDYDLIGFASGVYFNKFSKALINYVKGLQFLNQLCFVIYTSGAKRCVKCVNKFLNLLQEKGRNCLGVWHCQGRDVAFTFFKKTGGFNKGRPNDEDCQDAIEFVQSIVNKLNK